MNLRRYRKRCNLTMNQVATRSSIAESSYSLIENGKRRPSVETAKRIAKVLNFNWTEFFTDKEEEEQ